MSFEKFVYVTTPLYYVNAKPHIGHAYTTIVADVMARYYRQNEREVLFVTGTDEHGEKIALAAAEASCAPLEFATRISNQFRSTWESIGLKPDIFFRTTQQNHYAAVGQALQYLKDKGEIYFSEYEGKYCIGCERFRTDQEWNEEGLCPDHLKPFEIRKEANYWFKMSAYQKRLVEFYDAHPEAIEPAFYKNEVLSFLSQPLEDLCISRPVSRVAWGIPLPFDKNFVTYVWFDALLNYLVALGHPGNPKGDLSKFNRKAWDNVIHLIGKDILKTHAVYWPTMLMALGLEPARRLQVGGFWLTKGLKMSKSLGNVVDPLQIKESFGIEPFRYFLLREMTYGSDANFTYELFVTRANADLANGIGNLASRTLTLSHKNLSARVPSKKTRNESDLAFLAEVHALPAKFSENFEKAKFHLALAAFAEAVARTDLYINENKPWALAKDPAQKDRLEAVLGTAMDALWTLSVVSDCVIPQAAAALRAALGKADEGAAQAAEGRVSAGTGGEINSTAGGGGEGGRGDVQRATFAVPSYSRAKDLLSEGSALGEVPRLFPRLELPKAE